MANNDIRLLARLRIAPNKLDAFVTHIRGRVGTEILPKLRQTWELEFLYVYGNLSAEAEAEFRGFASDDRFAVFRPLTGYTR